MSRVLWFILGGVATAIGAGVAAALFDDEGSKIKPHQEEDTGADMLPKETE